CSEPRFRGSRAGRRAQSVRRRGRALGHGLRRRLPVAREPLRPHGRGTRAARRACRLRPVSPRGESRTARLALSLRPLPRARELMPRREDLRKILIVGSGPIVIGQAAEFDYSGVQACKVLGEEGYEVVLVNSNPATIMTDPGL